MKKLLENYKVNDIHLSRYIASWQHICGSHFGEAFKLWLKSQGFTESQIADAYEMATMGKMELESDILKFRKNPETKANLKFIYEELYDEVLFKEELGL